MNLVGAQVGNYVVERELGAGGMGTVYEAVHPLLGRKVAIKVLHDEQAADAETVARFFQEAKAAAEVGHEHIIEVIDFGEAAVGTWKVVYLMMELLDGESLGAKIARVGAFDPTEAVRVARAIADVLEATHAAGIIHRDLKPENVFLLADGRIKVLDFGAALSDNKPNEKAGTLGTPWYMAPEQAMGNPPDRRSDIYSLGCVLFEMITGNCPFDASDGRVVMAKHIEDPVPTPESPTGPLPEGLERAIMRSLAKHPDQRQQTAAEFGRELSQAGAAMTRPGWRKWLAL